MKTKTPLTPEERAKHLEDAKAIGALWDRAHEARLKRDPNCTKIKTPPGWLRDVARNLRVALADHGDEWADSLFVEPRLDPVEISKIAILLAGKDSSEKHPYASSVEHVHDAISLVAFTAAILSGMKGPGGFGPISLQGELSDCFTLQEALDATGLSQTTFEKWVRKLASTEYLEDEEWVNRKTQTLSPDVVLAVDQASKASLKARARKGHRAKKEISKRGLHEDLPL